MNNNIENNPNIGNQTYRLTSSRLTSSREASQLSSRHSSGQSSRRSSLYQNHAPYMNSVCEKNHHDNNTENIVISEEYLQREKTILSKHDVSSFPEKPRELFNPLNGLLHENKVTSKTFNVLPSITTPRSLTSRGSTGSQLSSRLGLGGSSNCNSPRSSDITPVILPPINKFRWNALKQSEDTNLCSGRAYWDVTQMTSRQSNANDTSRSSSYEYRSSPDGFS